MLQSIKGKHRFKYTKSKSLNHSNNKNILFLFYFKFKKSRKSLILMSLTMSLIVILWKKFNANSSLDHDFRFSLHHNWNMTLFILNLAFADLLYCITRSQLLFFNVVKHVKILKRFIKFQFLILAYLSTWFIIYLEDGLLAINSAMLLLL